ncbi:hypothetical protein AQPE_2577 [Aquipluma nitroreducens]|uniref:Uncharacterized protein n=1 Tax=Aquipluma nitroreducens TaxID=2010828 RepID=A0A5K7SA84_9BACT|nr:hypothetical protein [Aquipluma nitroreducens]BBE18415.1 hypothetical protein AQPE_2577 [Aquipluma nitroreducens]
MKKLKKTSLIFKMKSNEFVPNEDQRFKVPFRGFRGETCWQSWKAATKNPVEALKYE